jgi:hypothetical protein
MNENELTINGLYYYDIDNNKKTLRFLELKEDKYLFEVISELPKGEILLTKNDLNKLEKL